MLYFRGPTFMKDFSAQATVLLLNSTWAMVLSPGLFKQPSLSVLRSPCLHCIFPSASVISSLGGTMIYVSTHLTFHSWMPLSVLPGTFFWTLIIATIHWGDRNLPCIKTTHFWLHIPPCWFCSVFIQVNSQAPYWITPWRTPSASALLGLSHTRIETPQPPLFLDMHLAGSVWLE